MGQGLLQDKVSNSFVVAVANLSVKQIPAFSVTFSGKAND